MIQTFWREIAQTGVRTGLAPTEVQKIRLLNSIAFIGSLIFGLYLPIFLVLQINSAIFTSLLGNLLALLPIYFNHIGKYVFARFFFCIAMSIYLAAIGILFGEAVGMEHTLFAMGTIPAIFFNKRRHIFGLILFTVILFTLVKFSFYVVNPLIKHPIFSYFYSINVIITFSLLFITIAGFKQEHESYEKMIEKKNENITDSLKYAQRIQKAILGNEEEVLCNFKEGFIFLKPRDIVSGDFFWFSQLFFNTKERSSKRILIAADCTGHGVPGAFMTVMGNALLDEIVNEKCITTPHLILHELDRKIIATLQKQNFSQSDGMDVVILVIEEKDDNTKWVHWAGAKNPLYYVRDNKLHEIKGDKFPIGGNQSKFTKTFNTHTFELVEGDIFYLFTDGFQDQFGGEKNSKYLTKRFRNFLFEISHLPLSEQKEKIEREFTSWKGEHEQTDDVLVIGVQV